jgi:hypothetical protein
MKMFIIGFAVCYVISSLLILIDRYDWNNLYTTPLCAFWYAVMFIPCFFWHLFRHCVIGISQSDLAKVADLPSIHIGNFYVFHDKRAKYIWNKIFFARVLTNR